MEQAPGLYFIAYSNNIFLHKEAKKIMYNHNQW